MLAKSISLIAFSVVTGLGLMSSTPAKESIQKSNTQDSICAVYQYQSPDGFLLAITIELKNDMQFIYKENTEHQEFFSEGNWKIVKDTLILRSNLKKNNIPVVINEFSAELTDSLKVERVKNLEGDTVIEAMIFYNGDTMKSCMPVFDECNTLKASVKKIKLVFNNSSTKWYTLKNFSTTRVEPIVQVNFPLDNYIFLEEKRFLIGRKGLYGLTEQIEKSNGQDKVLLIKETSHFYKKIK